MFCHCHGDAKNDCNPRVFSDLAYLLSSRSNVEMVEKEGNSEIVQWSSCLEGVQKIHECWLAGLNLAETVQTALAFVM